jgi:hypothetical protein
MRMSLKLFIAVAAAGLSIWAAADFAVPRRSDLRSFDPAEVARLETAMWRSYYERRPAALYLQLGELLRSQYRFAWLRSQFTAFDAARAAFVFKRGRGRADYERALPALRGFYAAIRRDANIGFDVNEAARLELEWWIIHRERATSGKPALEKALAELQACLYRANPAAFKEHAAARAEAMILRDDRAAHAGVTPQDWRRIRELLETSWRSLHAAVNTPVH